MKFLWIFSILFFLTDNVPSFVKGKGYEGYIFPENHFVMVSVENQKSRYTPSESDVRTAEQLLKKGIAILNKTHANQIGHCPIIEKNLEKYKRQYVGFINKEGQKILWINFIWNKNLGPQLSEDIISVLDGCSYYWNIKVNISNMALYDLKVNGMG